MAYTTLNDVKIKLGIPLSDTSQDDVLNYYIDRTTLIMDNYFGVSLEQGTKEDEVKLCDFRQGCCNYYVPFRCANVTAVNSINGDLYNGVLGTDYKVIKRGLNNEVLFYNLKNTLNSQIFFCYITIEYEAGYNPIPLDLAFAQDLLVEGYYTQRSGRDVISERSGPRSVTFASLEDSKQFMNIISFYTAIRL